MAGRLRVSWFVPALVAVTVNCLDIAPAQARDTRSFSVPGGSLSDALLAWAEQAGISIAITDPGVGAVRTQGVFGRLEPTEALRRLLKGSGYDFVLVDARTVRLVRHPAEARPRRAPVKPPRPAPVEDSVGADIVVTATKQHLGLGDYPASLSVVKPEREELARAGARGTGYILGKLPELSSTNLGRGRNKIFIRGIADSSFNGTSQATISQYLGDMRLIYSAPDPDLAPYDIKQVEVLEGPQGTLYGAGTLGGIIRLVPNAPDLGETAVEASLGARLTQDGAPGGDGAVMGNVPLIADKLGLRAVVYRSVEGGYIDDTSRGVKDVNRNLVTGFRATLRWAPDAAWKVDATVVQQDLVSRDGQYTLKGDPDLTRSSAIAQPFDNDYRLVGLTVSRTWASGMELVSATGYAHQNIDTVFDATGAADTTAREYEEEVAVRLISHETRLTGHWGRGGTWLAGVGFVHNVDHAERKLGDPDDLASLSDSSTATLDAAVFGEVGVPLLDRLMLTLGGRFSYVRQTSKFMDEEDLDYEPERSQHRFLPSAALAWKPIAGALLYARYQQGYRPGGLQVTGSASDPSANRFVSDRIETFELGLRFGMEKAARLSGSVAGSIARWRDIQADLIDIDGLPYVANIGSGRVQNIAVSLAWHPIDALSLEAAGFIASSSLSDPAPGYDNIDDRDLPNIADQGWRVAARYSHDLDWATLSIDSALRYVGHSKLAVIAPFALSQGRYYDLTAGARLDFGRWGVSVDIDNALNDRGNTFAFGNPFTVAVGLQQTPMRPRSLRIGFDAAF